MAVAVWTLQKTCGCTLRLAFVVVGVYAAPKLDFESLERSLINITRPYTPDCERVAGLPQTKAQWQRVVAANTPLIFHDGADIFGPQVAMWGNRSYLLQRLGKIKLLTSVFDIDRTADAADRFTTRPIRSRRSGDYKLVMALKKDMTIGEMIRHDWRATRQLVFAEQADAYNVIEMHPPLGMPRRSPIRRKGLYEDIALAPFLRERPGTEMIHFNLWMGKIPSARDGRHPGRKDGVEPIPGMYVKEAALHNDANDNLLLQLSGTKTVWMYGMADSKRLYEQDMLVYEKTGRGLQLRKFYQQGEHHMINNFSPFNPLKPDYNELPRAREARLKRCTLKPGEVLYMPAGTWHDVISTPDKDELNIAANLWSWTKCGNRSPFKRVTGAMCENFPREVADPRFEERLEYLLR